MDTSIIHRTLYLDLLYKTFITHISNRLHCMRTHVSTKHISWKEKARMMMKSKNLNSKCQENIVTWEEILAVELRGSTNKIMINVN